MAKDSRPYSSPNFPKEKEKEKKKEERPYSSPNFPKEEEPKSSTPAYNQGVATGTPKPPTTSVPAYNQGIAGGTNNKSSAPAYNQGITGDQKKSINSSSSVQQQNKANIAFINNLNPVNTFSVSPFNMLSNAEIVQAFNAPRNTPTSVSNIKKNLNITTRPYSSPNYKKELYKSIQAQQQPQQPTKVEEVADNDNYWRNNRKQSVSYATSIDYYNMERKGYDTVYIEEGNEKLKNKGGVYTIGRDRLEGLPRNVKTVCVDNDGNWKYLVDTTTRAAHAEALQGKRDAATKIYEYTADKETRLTAAAEKQREVLYNRIIKIYQETVNKDKSPENLRRLQAAVNALSAYDKVIDDSRGRLTQATAKWAKDYEYYNIAMRANTKWTVEEEAQYQQLLQDMKQTYTSSEQVAANAALFTQFAAMTKRREANKSCAAYLNTDYLNKLKDTEKAMAKAVEMYNEWDSVTIHMEEGEDLGTQLKRLITTSITDRHSDNLFTDESKAKRESVFKGFGNAIVNQFKPIGTTIKEYNKAADAYYEVQRRIAEKDYKNQDELNDLYAKRTEYLKASNEAISQGKNVMFNNIVANLSVFDIFNVQHTFVAWRMAKHPERYLNDPKFASMKRAFEDIYGTDYKGAMDAGKMAQAMFKIKLGDTDTDYIYLDGSDLRHSNNKNYGFWGSLAVGMLTDVSSLAGIVKGASGVVTRKLGAAAVAKSTTDSFIQSLVRAEVAESVAKEFATSSTVQKALRKDINAAIKNYMRNGGDDLTKTIKNTIMERARLLDDFATNDFKRLIDKNHYDDFLRNAEDFINNSDNITKTVLNVEKGTVLTHALGNIDDALNELQSIAFKATCPAAGAVVGIAHLGKAIKNAKNLKLASESELHRVTRTAKQVTADIDNLGFKSIVGTNFRKQWQGIQDEWYNGVIGRIKEVSQDFKARPELYGKSYEEIVRPFSECSDYLLRESANSYTYHIIHKLDTALDTYKLGEDRFAELLKLAQENGYETFDDMLAVIEDNIKIIYDASPDAKYIVDAFKRKYDDAILKNNIANIRKYVDNTAAHVDDIRRILNTDGTPIISKVNATINPVFVQQNAKTVADSVFDFLQTVNNDYTTFVDEFGKLKSIHETGTELINALNNITLGDLDDISILRAQDALRKYIDEMDTVYLKQLKDWEANTIQDAIGVQDYLKNINTVVPDYAGVTEIQNRLADTMQKFFEEKGVNITTDEIFSNILKSNPEEFLKLPEAQQASLIYRVMENKGSNLIGQISDANLKIITDGITDCNAQLSKNLRLLQINLPEDSEAYQLISSAISSACAVEHTRMLYTYLKASNIDSTLQMTIMDVLAGSSNKINSMLQMYPPEIASVKLRDYIVDQVKYQLSQHNGQYSLYKNFGCNSVDVGSNVLKIEEVINNSDYSKLFPADDNCIDICMSTLRSTDGTAPKDIAFHVRGSEEAPTVLRKNSKFTVYDDGFASRTYGSTAQQLNDGYAALGDLETLTDDEWTKQFQDYINKVKQQALEENKTIRFIGFNTSNAVSGDNKFISDILRANGVNANTANAIDFADLIRAANNQYVFDSNDIDALTRGLRTVADTAKSKSITLGVRNVLAYDPKYTCADMLQRAMSNTKFDVDILNEQAKYILESTETVAKGLNTDAYNEIGNAMGTYINATAFAKVLDDAGLSSVHASGDLMKIITNATVSGESQLGLHKIVENAMDDVWIDRSKFVKAYAIKDFNNLERVHDSILQINRINESIHRADLITDKDVVGLKRIFNDVLFHSGLKRNSHLYSVARAIKVDDLTPQQLYSATKWVLDNLQEIIDPDKYNEVFSIMLIEAKEQATKLTDMGYKFIRDNIVDYTNDSLDAFLVKYLDTSEEGYKFAQALDELAKLRRSNDNLKNYMDAVEGLFNRYEIHGVQDRMVLYQLADVHAPIMDLHDEMLATYDYAYGVAMKELQEEATAYTYKKVRGTYSRDMMERVATERAVRAAKQHIIELGDTARSESVQVVANLDADAFRAHLIRNCCGGIIIDPTSKAVKDIDLVTLFEQWRGYGVTIDAIDFSQGAIKNKKLFRVYIDDLGEKNADEIFTKYNNTHITFDNHTTRKYSQHVYGEDSVHIRHSSFDASDMTLMNANHVDAFRDLFFKRYGGERMGKNILDLNTNFKSWANELYSCNMWADMELKQLVNPYYTDNMLNNLAQTTHQLRNNITAVHDLGTIVNNRYMNSKYILSSSGVLQPGTIAEQRKTIVKQITDSKQHLCKITLDKSNRFKVVDYTPRLLKKNTSDEFFEAILNNTVMLDEGMMECLADWSKSTSIALKMQASNAPDWLPTAYNLYKKTIRSATVTMYLYGNLGTAIRNFVDSSTKGANEVMQYNGDMLTYLSKYKNAVSDVHEYTNIYRQIEEDLGTVNHETITKFFGNNTEGLNKFNILYGYEQVCGESILQEATIKELHSKNVEYLMKDTNIDNATAKKVRKIFDNVYGSPKYYGMTNAQLEKHMKEIHDACMDAVYDKLHTELIKNKIDLKTLSDKFWDYHPTVTSWGDKMTQFPVLGFNKARFNNAETRARLAIYQTFLESGASEVDAIKHVTATQFHYAGLGKVEDFMPFTQYKLYNALYWFDHANARAVSTAWRAAQYNGDGAMTNEEISNMIAKYRQKSYYIYDAGMDEAYDNYFQNTLEPAIEGLFEVDSYLGVPRESGKGNFDLNGTHYIKLGNSFIDELDLVTTCMSSATIFAATMRANLQADSSTADKIRWSYQSLKYTPLYDSFYSPWKSYADLVVYTYDHYKMIAQHEGRKIDKITSKDVWDCYKAYLSDKTTRSVAVSGIPVVGAILSNLAGRWKSFNLNAGLIAAAAIDPDSREELFTFAWDRLCDVTGMFIPSLVGTKVEPDKNTYDYYRDNLSKIIVYNPGTFFDMYGRLQREMGFTEDQAKEIMASINRAYNVKDAIADAHPFAADKSYVSKQDYYSVMRQLYCDGFTQDEIVNMFKQYQINIPDKTFKRFNVMANALPSYLRYDKNKRSEIIAYYKAMGMSSDEAWAKLINNPAIIENGRLRELSYREVLYYNNLQQKTYEAIKKQDWLTDEEWDAYWDNMAFRYPKGKWSETYHYLVNAGYTSEDARRLLLNGYMLDENGMLVDVPGKARSVYSYSSLQGAEWDAYWNSLPDYTKYEKGAFGRTMKALKKQGYSEEQARLLIQQGIYVDKNGNMMNVTGMQRPVLGFPNFSAYYNSIPEYCRYEKGAFKRTYAALRKLGFGYEQSLKLIQEGAYLLDMSLATSTIQTLGARRNKDGSAVTVTNITTLMAAYGGQVIIGDDGKPYIIIDCRGLTRPRKSFGYSRRGGGGGGRGGYQKRSYPKRIYAPRAPKIKQYNLRKPFVTDNNVSTFSGFTNFRGSNKLTKPYTTKGYVSTFSTQNFLNGASYGMRKTYKIDMRQFKSGALSTKSAYPTSYRNISVAYRRSMYKDLYAKYGMSRMRMRSNQPGYSNASIVRLRRNEIQNRERYAERRDIISKLKIKKKASD